jgi:hypothetical protein
MNTRSHQSDDVTQTPQLPLLDTTPRAERTLTARAALDDLAAGQSSGCCSFGDLLNRLSARSFAMTAMLAVTLLAVAVAGYFAGVASGVRDSEQSSEVGSLTFPTTIDATGAVSSEKFSIATGLVSEEAEGFFVLDHNSGLLQCSVFYPRVGKFLANFTINAGELIGAGGKGGSYIMVTGQADMTRGGRGAQIAPTLVYVLNTASGNFAAFAIPFDRQAAVTNRPQQAALIPVGTGTASVLPTR